MRKFYSVLLLFLIICFPFIVAEAQEKLLKTIPELTLPNPETASLGKYGEVPMNMYTGIANISIPLYTLSFDGLEIPINLSYNTEGIRTGQEASWVGLGWTLSCEPVITRQIKGLCDITNGYTGGATRGYIYTDISLPTYNSNTEKLIEQLKIYYYPFAHAIGWDMEPDIFTANIFGESVSFILVPKAFNNGSVGVKMINGDKGYKVVYNESGKSFTITNNKGFRFYFSQKEYSLASSYVGSGSYAVQAPYTDPLITGWKLDKITSPKERLLNFEYISAATESQPAFSHTLKTIICEYGNSNAYFPENNGGGESSSLNSYIISYLKSIISDDISIEFKTSDRSDMRNGHSTNASNFIGVAPKGPQKLDNIIIKNSLNDVINNYKFSYSYFNEQYLNNASYSLTNLRLKLNLIENIDLFYRSFSYINANQLPSKIDNRNDFWGFHNGNYTFISGVPAFKKTYPCSVNNVQYIEGGNKIPDFNFARNGLLETVIYPTKGYTKLNYEANDIKVDKNNIEKFEPYKLVEPKKVATVESRDSIGVLSDIFEIKNIGGAELLLNITFGMGGIYDYTWPGASNIKYTVEDNDIFRIAYQIINVDTGIATLSGNFTKEQGTSKPGIGPVQGDNNWNKKSRSVKLSKGRYRIKATGLRHISNLFAENEGATSKHPDYMKIYKCSVKVEASIPALTDAEAINLVVGGIRIKSIENFDNTNSLLTKKEYKYINSKGVSSGVLMDDLVFYNGKNYMFYSGENSGQPYTFEHKNVLEIYSHSILNSPSPNHIGYSRVEEISTDKGNTLNNGKMVSEFINKPNKYGVSISSSGEVILTCIGNQGAPHGTACPSYSSVEREIAVMPSSSYQDINGKLLKEIYYNDLGKRMRESVFQYSRDTVDVNNFTHPQIIATGIAHYKNLNYGFPASTSTIYALQIYKIFSENISLLSRTDTEYLNDIATTSKKTTYQYNSDFLPSKIIEESSITGKNKEVAYQYPRDLLAKEQVSFMQKFVNNNIISNPVITKIAAGTSQTLESHIKYKEVSISYKENNQNLTKGVVVPDEVHQITGTGNITIESTDKTNRRISYPNYDSFGNPVYITKDDINKVIYLWSYNGQYPIAKIENATYSQITSIITEASLKSISEKITPSATDMQTINGLRTNANLTDAMVTTYTYKPLVGVLTMTDPRGVTTYYDYDAFGRLKETYIIESGVKKVIQVNEYHYQNQ